MKDRVLEIMAPAGNFECLHAAIQGGADSVYFGVEKLNMRSHSANNFKMTDLKEIVRICSEFGVKTYLTLNITLYNEDLEDMKRTLEAAKEAGITAVIASDMAAIAYARQIGVEVHISTQLSISNIDALKFYAQFADVIVLARELNLGQVKEIKRIIDEEQICGPSGRIVEIEMFAHGALCMAVSASATSAFTNTEHQLTEDHASSSAAAHTTSATGRQEWNLPWTTSISCHLKTCVPLSSWTRSSMPELQCSR